MRNSVDSSVGASPGFVSRGLARLLWTTILVTILALPLVAEQAAPDEAEPEMQTYQLVLILANPDFKRDDSVSEMLADHRDDRHKMASELYLRSLIESQWALVAGPVEGHERIRYVAILKLPSANEAEDAFRENPGVQSGRLEVEVYSLEAPADVLRFPKDPGDTRYAHLGLLMRPRNLPELPAERLEEIRRGRLEHNEVMIASGQLVLEGKVERGGDLRGIMIFRTRSPEPIRELVAPDPAIESGRLVLELYRWRVPRRSWVWRGYQTGEDQWP